MDGREIDMYRIEEAVRALLDNTPIKQMALEKASRIRMVSEVFYREFHFPSLCEFSLPFPYGLSSSVEISEKSI